MTTTEIRIKLAELKTKHEAALAQSKEACSKIETLLKSLGEEELQVLATHGLDVTSLMSVDYNRLQTDSEYLESFKRRLDSVATELNNFLEQQIAKMEG